MLQSSCVMILEGPPVIGPLTQKVLHIGSILEVACHAYSNTDDDVGTLGFSAPTHQSFIQLFRLFVCFIVLLCHFFCVPFGFDLLPVPVEGA